MASLFWSEVAALCYEPESMLPQSGKLHVNCSSTKSTKTKKQFGGLFTGMSDEVVRFDGHDSFWNADL